MSRNVAILTISSWVIVLTIAIVGLIRHLDGISFDESINDTICKIEHSRGMPRITMCESNREVTLVVGTGKIHQIRSFINLKDTKIIKEENSHNVYLTNSLDTLILKFESGKFGGLIKGEIIE